MKKIIVLGLIGLLLLIIGCSKGEEKAIAPTTAVENPTETEVQPQPVQLCRFPIRKSDFDELSEYMSDKLDTVSSEADFQAWLQEQPCVKSIQADESLLDTTPPQRRYVVVFTLYDKSTTTKGVYIELLPDQQFKFVRIEDLDIRQTTEIQLDMRDSYKEGDAVFVKIKNIGKVPYLYYPNYEACNFEFSDESGKNFRIPAGVRCGSVAAKEIYPGETKTLFRWQLDECVRENVFCVDSKPLPEGKYTLGRTFNSTDSRMQSRALKTIGITTKASRLV